MSNTATGLTDLDSVKAFAFPGKNTSEHDNLINLLIRQTTGEIEQEVGDIIARDYTDVIDGSALGSLILNHGPVLSLILRDASGTVIDSSTYEVDAGARLIVFVTDGVLSNWVEGTRNYTAVYRAGFKRVPDGIEGIATDIVARRLKVIIKDSVGIVSQVTASGGETSFESREITEAEWNKLRNAVHRL